MRISSILESSYRTIRIVVPGELQMGVSNSIKALYRIGFIRVVAGDQWPHPSCAIPAIGEDVSYASLYIGMYRDDAGRNSSIFH